MRLKSLELHGYKTFASRTIFEFAGTITAIVGPNGSGKSNIADSLRWVLGEQSYSLLRGKKTEDMIFSGSEHRQRAGMASASVVFDNSDGWLPIDFSEVAITRRAYRDGQNEYLINGQRVRLRDVSELLAQSGLAERTYTIIGQGLVDAALALKAEERRRLFEEAAGIGLHRSRREEALRRLETTQRNLDRVQDILAELQPRLRSLEKQARRAREFEQVRADLRVLLREWYGYHWHRAQKELTRAREACRGQETILERARQEQTGLSEELAVLRDRIQGLRSRLSSWHRQSAQYHTERESLTRQRAVNDERSRSIAEQQQNIQGELARLQEELGLRQDQFRSAREEVQRLEADLEEARAQLAAARGALQARQTERQQIEKELQAARQELSALNARQGQLQARQAERKLQAARQEEALLAAGQAVEAAQKELEAAQARAEAAANARAQAAADRGKVEEAIGVHQKNLAEAEARRRALLEKRSAHRAELARGQAQLEVLAQAENALSGYAAGAQILLKAARENRIQGASGALSRSLDVPAALETAIGAALGEYLDALVIQHGAEAEEAMNILAGQPARGVLLPLDRLNPGTPLRVPESNGKRRDSEGSPEVLGVAADLVQAPPELRPAVDLLLGQILVVRDRPSALRALAGQPLTARAVTLQGEVYSASGPIQAGSPGQAILSRPRQLRELENVLQSVQTEIDGLEEQLGEIDRSLQALKAEEQRSVEALREARRAEEKAIDADQQAGLAVEQARRQGNWQTGQLERLEAELRDGASEAARITGELDQLAEKLNQSREAVRQRNAALNELNLDEHQSQVTHWKTLVEITQASQAAHQNRLREQQSMLERAERAQASAQARLEELAAALKTLEAEKSNLRGEEEAVNGQIEALQILIDPAETELEGAERDQERLQQEEAAARQSLGIAEHQYAQTRIVQVRHQEALDGLRRRIEDDFGLVSFDYADEISGPKPLPLEGMVEELPLLTKISPEIEETIKRQRAQLRRMGAINPEAQTEYQEVRERFTFLTTQVSDLEKAEVDVRKVIAELDALMQAEFRKTFDAVAGEFKTIFSRLFDGGNARLILTDPDDLTNTGIDIEARLPGRRTQGLSLLSGGERSLTATALVFALLKVSPTPFCVLDEVDAMLDEANVGRFRELLRELSQNTQFIVVTHNRNTVQVADVIYGVTMGRDSASQVISLKLDEVSRIVE